MHGKERHSGAWAAINCSFSVVSQTAVNSQSFALTAESESRTAAAAAGGGRVHGADTADDTDQGRRAERAQVG